jgi:hypothetical protein
VVCVAIPHETFPFLPRSPEHLARTVALCTEQPGTIFFAQAAAWADACGAAVDISPVGTLALREAGVAARHLQLGWTPSLPLAPLDGPRPVDVLYLGSAAARREVLLSGYADALWPLESRLLIPPHWAKLRERADFVVGARKRELPLPGEGPAVRPPPARAVLRMGAGARRARGRDRCSSPSTPPASSRSRPAST